jgi:plastocyanin
VLRAPSAVKLVLPLALIAVAVGAALWLAPERSAAGGANVTITVDDFWFCSENEGETPNICERKISVGDTITWDFGPANIQHTSTECGNVCGSVIANPGSRLWHFGPAASGQFQRTFNSAGTFEYQCNIHPSGALAMRARIIVNPGGAPTSTPGPPGAKGDVNNSGAVDAIDAALILQLNAGLIGSVPNPAAADVDQGGAVNSIDAALILQFVAGLLPALPP